jgi:RsiW-degrading membrane proteinase PrsW (M82 family)
LAVLGSQIRAVPWAELVPLRAWWSDGGWRQGWVGLFSVFALATFILLQLTAGDQDVHRIAWGFALYFALLWFVVLYGIIRPPEVNWWTLARIVLVTAIAGTAIAIFLEKHLAPDDSNFLRMILGVGLPEEFAKAVAVYVFVYRSKTLSTTRTYLFVGAVSGLAFGAAEAVSYTQKYADLASYFSPTSYTALITWRLLTDSLLHATFAGICAYFIGLAFRYPQSRWALISIGLGLAALLHGAYDSLSSGWPGTVMAALTVFVFAGYVRSGDQIADRLAGTALADRAQR